MQRDDDKRIFSAIYLWSETCLQILWGPNFGEFVSCSTGTDGESETVGNLDNGPTEENPVGSEESGISTKQLLIEVIEDSGECCSSGSQNDIKPIMQEMLDNLDVDEQDS